jgi:hypothetical protein
VWSGFDIAVLAPGGIFPERVRRHPNIERTAQAPVRTTGLEDASRRAGEESLGMKCHYCGSSVRVSLVVGGDSDFCSSQHRAKFQARLKKGLDLLTRQHWKAPTPAGPITGYNPCDALAPISSIQSTMAFSRSIKLPQAALPVVVDPPPEFKQRVKGPALDRIASLGSRLGSLRGQLQRAMAVEERKTA